jgi:aspartyl protease family protein
VIGWAFRQIVILAGIAALLYAVVGYRLFEGPGSSDHAPVPGSAAAVMPAQSAAASTGGAPNSLTFHANKQGHVLLDAVVNGAPVKFLVDTGATAVALTLQDAAAAGISGNNLDYRLHFRTANGVARAAPVTLRELRIGQLVIYDVQAVVQEHLFGSLLGQSFLTRIDSYEMRDGVLTLNYW